MWTGVDLGEMKGEAGGDWPGPWARGEMGWKLKCRLLVPGEGGTGQLMAPPPDPPPVSASLTIIGWKETRLLVDSESVWTPEPTASAPLLMTASSFPGPGSRKGRLVLLKAPPES